MIHNGNIPERIAVLPDVDGGAGGANAQHENGDYQIDETLLNNPPIKGEVTGLIPNHWLNRTSGRGRPRKWGPGVSPNQAATLPVQEFNIGRNQRTRCLYTDFATD
jgi:hypothetical protein